MTLYVTSLMVILIDKAVLLMEKPTTAQIKFLKKVLAKIKEETQDISVNHIIEVPSLADSLHIQAVFYVDDIDKLADFIIEHINLDQVFDVNLNQLNDLEKPALKQMMKNIVFELETYGEFDSLINSGLEFQDYTDVY